MDVTRQWNFDESGKEQVSSAPQDIPVRPPLIESPPQVSFQPVSAFSPAMDSGEEFGKKNIYSHSQVFFGHVSVAGFLRNPHFKKCALQAFDVISCVFRGSIIRKRQGEVLSWIWNNFKQGLE